MAGVVVAAEDLVAAALGEAAAMVAVVLGEAGAKGMTGAVATPMMDGTIEGREMEDTRREARRLLLGWPRRWLGNAWSAKAKVTGLGSARLRATV
jgi:hypothetical protein